MTSTPATAATGACCSHHAASPEIARVLDPVCGMSVDPNTTPHRSDHAGETSFFCSAGCRVKFEAHPERYRRDAASTKDPVCGMTVDPARTGHHAEHNGTTYHFCCDGCRAKFSTDPERYLGGAPRAAREITDPAAVHTCPMHPEVEQIGPGACPKCGMALEPKEITAERGPNPELIDMTRRMWVAAALAIPVVILAMSQHLIGRPLISPPWNNVLQGTLATVVVLWAGQPFFVRGWQSVMVRHLNMFTLIAIGTGAAWLYSLVATLMPDVFPRGFREPDGSVGVYFEAATVIVVLVLVGQVLELRARDATGDALRALLDLAPKSARRIERDGRESDVSLAEITVGEHLRVRPGESVPVDGRVTEGSGTVDESMVTGEAMGRAKQPGDLVIGGTVNRTGSFIMVSEKVGRDTMLAGIVQLVGTAQRSRAPVQRLADTVSGRFVPAVLAAAALAFAGWVVFGPEPRFAHALIAGVAVLIVACPCALGLATPMSMVVGIGRGARMGVLVREAAALERLEAVDTLVFDKTGTLTEGRPALTAIEVASGDDRKVLRLVAALEQASEHPIAQAVVAAAQARGLALPRPEAVSTVAGQGVSGRVEGHEVVVGTAAFQAGRNVQGFDPLDARAEALRRGGATVVLASIDGVAAGLIAVADPVKASAPDALAALRRGGLRLVMMTGDHAVTASAVADRLGIDAVHSGLPPDGKAALVADLQREGRVVAMAGDGINDAPALAKADVGIAMGTGTDIAIQSAGLTLLNGDLAALDRARLLSRATMRNIRQNLAFAFAYNALGVPIAAGLLYPVFGLTLSPMLAAAAMALSSVSVIANALRLRAVRLG